jgi:exodeoxyribonuclease VII large subunit
MLQANQLSGLERRAQLAWSRSWQQRQQQLDYLTARLKHPTAKIQQQTQRVNAAQRRLNQAMQHQLQVLKQAYALQQKQFQQVNLPQQIKLRSAAIQQTQLKLSKLMQQRVDQCKARLQQQMRTLAAVSPLNTLERGYSIATEADSNAVLVNAGQVKVGDAVTVRLHQGSINCEVKNIENN